METAKFKVIKIDPEGSGMDWSGHLGAIVTDAFRCCENCTIIFGSIDDINNFGPFIIGELEPLNEEAEKLLANIL